MIAASKAGPAKQSFLVAILISFYFAGLLWVLATTRKAKRQ
jgi:hypothetical protein